jgi:hypothetical protein
MQVIKWLANGKTGQSSETMAFWLAFNVKKADSFGFAYPHDGGDLGRCLQLLVAAPELRKLVPNMAELSPEWAALAARWDDLTEVTTRGHDAVYQLLKGILRPIEDKRGDTVHISKNMSIRMSPPCKP